MSEGKWERLFGGAKWWTDSDGVMWYERPSGHREQDNAAAFVADAKQELLRLIVDVQQNRNRPEGME